MSLPASEYWFSTTVRRNRLSFMIANVILVVIAVIVVGALYFFEANSRVAGIVVLIFYVPYFIAQYFLSAQRFRDLGLTGWCALLWLPVGALSEYFGTIFVLGFLLILIALPGTKGRNKYGEDPLEY
mgnify:CR=1 FL=1